MYRHLFRSAACATLIVHFSPLLLADEYESGHPIPEIIVTADPLGSIDRHLARPVDVIDAEALRSRDMRSIGELVAREPGVSTSDFGAAVGRPVIRGLSGGRVRVLEDGIGTMDASTISADHSVTTEALFAEQVEIFRGPATLLYGSGAAGGLVNIVTRRILDYAPEHPEGRLQFQYDTAAQGYSGAGMLNAGRGPAALHLEGMFRSAGDYRIPGFGERFPDADAEHGRLDNSAVDSGSVGGGLSFIGTRGSAGIALTRYWNEYGIPGGHHHDEETGHAEHVTEEEGGVVIDQDQLRFDLAGQVELPLPGVREVRLRLGRNDYEHAEIEPDGAVATRFDNREWEGRVELLHPTSGAWHAVSGLQFRDRDFSAVGEEAFVPPSQQESIALFALGKGDYGTLHLELGARWEREESSSRERAAGADFGAWSVSAGAGWDYAEDYSVGLALTRADRVPSIEELYADGPHLATNSFELGDPALGLETSLNFDLYWHRTSGRLTWSANLFYNRLADFIFLNELDLNGDGLADRVEADFSGDPAEILTDADELLLVRHVQDDVDLYGLELEVDLNLFNDRRGDLHLRAWTDYVRGRVAGGPDLPRITPWRIGAGLDYRRGRWSLLLDYMRVQAQHSTAPLETHTPGHDSLDLYAGYSLPVTDAELTLFLRASNLFDEEIRRHTSLLKDQAPLPGRAALLGLRVEFL